MTKRWTGGESFLIHFPGLMASIQRAIHSPRRARTFTSSAAAGGGQPPATGNINQPREGRGTVVRVPRCLRPRRLNVTWWRKRLPVSSPQAVTLSLSKGLCRFRTPQPPSRLVERPSPDYTPQHGDAGKLSRPPVLPRVHLPSTGVCYTFKVDGKDAAVAVTQHLDALKMIDFENQITKEGLASPVSPFSERTLRMAYDIGPPTLHREMVVDHLRKEHRVFFSAFYTELIIVHEVANPVIL